MSESSSATGRTYRAFLSYSHADKAWADWLHRALESYRVPRRLVGMQTGHGVIPRRLHPVFRDREELASATDLGRKVNEALAQSENLIVICSPAAAASRWINEEVLAWRRMGRGERTFCLIVAGEPYASDVPGRAAEECFCPALCFGSDADGRAAGERTESIAADARPGKDSKANAKLKLIAGMLDIGFDALKQREQHRRMQRMAVITALALVVMAVTSVLAVYALASRHAAVVAQAAAERRQKQAEDLVGFMLGDLNDKLEQVQRLDIMQAVNEKALAYFRSLPNTDVTPETLAQRAKALEKIGVVRMNQGHLPPALEAFRASIQISSKLAAAAPLDVPRQLAYARTSSYVGLTYWYQGKLGDAQQQFELALRLLQRAEARAQNDLELKFELQNASNNIGHVLEARNLPAAAEGAYRKTLELAQALVNADPNNTDWAAALGDAHNNLGKLALQRGDLVIAIAEYRADDAIQTRLSVRNANENDQRERMLTSRAIHGRTLALVGNVEAGIHNLQQAVAIANQLAESNPHHAGFAEHAAYYSAQLAMLQRLRGDLAAAGAHSARSIATLSILIQGDPSNASLHGDYAAALTEHAAEARARGQIDTARRQVKVALGILDPMLAQNPDERDTLLATMTARLLLADVSAKPQAAQSLRETALKTMQAQRSGKSDPRLLALQVEGLLALGRKAEALPLLKQLWNSGYRDLALVDAVRYARIDYPPNPDFQARLMAATEHIGNPEASPPAGNKQYQQP